MEDLHRMLAVRYRKASGLFPAKFIDDSVHLDETFARTGKAPQP
jgi:hypothetical protein